VTNAQGPHQTFADDTDPARPDPGASDPQAMTRRYETALRECVEEDSEAGLMAAYTLARDALAQDIQLTEIMDVHFAASHRLLVQHGHSHQCRDQIESFAVEFLSVYDMALKGYKTSVPRLLQEVADRQKAEAELRQASAQLAAQRDTLDKLVAERTRDLLKKTEVLDKTLDTLRQANREQAEFTYAISHDLKSPSNTITMLSDELEISLGEQLDVDAAELLSLIRMTSVRMGRLVDDVLAYSRCLDHQAPLAPVDLNQVLRDILEDLRFDIIRSGATITVADVPSVIGDQMQVKLLFQNLVANAIKYCAPGRPPRVLITAKIQPTHVRVTVSDNGIGIAPQHFERIFTLFQRLHTYDTYPGSGIGLALCKRIAANLGGELSLTSRQGVGSSFSIALKRFVA
jgi:signal transduction histidine kinase